MVGQTPVNLHTAPAQMWQPNDQAQLRTEPRCWEGLNAGIAPSTSPKPMHPENLILFLGLLGQAEHGWDEEYPVKAGRCSWGEQPRSCSAEMKSSTPGRHQRSQEASDPPWILLMAKAELQHHPQLSRLLCGSVTSL